MKRKNKARRAKRSGPIDWRSAREQWSTSTPMNKEERLAVLRVRVQTAISEFIVRPDSARHGILNVAANALALEWNKP